MSRSAVFLFIAAVLSASVAHAFTPQIGKLYKLKTQFQGPDKCLEGNKRASTSTLGGAAFMDNCQRVSGQAWKFVPDRDYKGYYRMKTVFRGDDECFRANRFGSKILGGASFMDQCKYPSRRFPAIGSGQQWRIQPVAGTKYFTLTVRDRIRRNVNECLEGNKFAPSSTLKGAAFFAGCKPFTGQLFYAEEI